MTALSISILMDQCMSIDFFPNNSGGGKVRRSKLPLLLFLGTLLDQAAPRKGEGPFVSNSLNVNSLVYLLNEKVGILKFF